MRFRKKMGRTIGIAFLVLWIGAFSRSAFAESNAQDYVDDEVTKVPLEVPIGGVTAATLSEYIVVLHQYLVSTAAIFAVIYMMFGGYRWIFAAGNKQHVASAQDMIWTSAVGLFLALTSYILLVTLNPQTVKFPILSIPRLSDKELTFGGAKSICSEADIIVYRSENNDAMPTCGQILSFKKKDGTTAKCMATINPTSSRICEVTRDMLGEYTKAEPVRRITVRDPEGDSMFYTVIDTLDSTDCGMYTWYPTSAPALGYDCLGEPEIHSSCFIIKGQPLINDVLEKLRDMKGPDFAFVKGEPTCMPR